MKKTIFRKISLIILVVVLLVDAALLVVSYRLAYKRSYDSCVKQLENASGIVEEWVSYFDTGKPDSMQVLSASLASFCKHLDLPYMYVLNVNKDRTAITYMAIGFGEDASQEAKDDIRIGTERKLDPMPQEMLDALDHPGNRYIEHLKNQYGETLICYTNVHLKMNDEGDMIEISTPYLIGVEISLSSVMDEIRQSFDLMTVLLVLLSIMISVATGVILYRRVSMPARMISRRMSSFVEDYNQGIQPLPVKGQDEFAEMSRSFNTMAENISGYIGNIDRLNQEKHVRQAELDIAGDIQLGLLAKAHFRKPQFEIHACMFPAKDVGGDLYDYLELENGKVFMAVADVSGKGITASLFMSRAVTLLHLYAKMGYSPAQILREYNNTLSENNAGGLFITTFVAVYDPETRKLTYSNGGHNIPYVLSNRLIPLDGAQGIASGLFADEDFEEAEISLKPGDCVFMYTDGVNEAQNMNNELFTTERLEDELKALFGKSAEQVVRTIRAHLLDFAGGAEQSDDITMIAFQPTSIGGEKKIGTGESTIKMMQSGGNADRMDEKKEKTGEPLYHKEFHFPADPQNMGVLRDAIAEIPGVPENLRMNLLIMIDEIYANICSYGYDGEKGVVDVTIDVTDRVTLIFIDDGKPFDPTQDLPDMEEFDHMNTIGGLGRFITFELADNYSYERVDGKNVLRLEKMLEK